MKLERTRMRNAAHTCSLLAVAVVGVLAVAPSVAPAETHGDVIRGFATDQKGGGIEPIDLKLGYQLKCSWFQQFYFQELCRYAMMLDQLKEGDGSLLDHVVLFAFTEYGAPVSSWGTGSNHVTSAVNGVLA